MIQPSLAEFRSRARLGNLIPVYRELPAGGDTPVSAFSKLLAGEHAFLLESAEGEHDRGRYSFFGADPAIVFRAKDERVEIFEAGRWSTQATANPLVELRALMARYRAVPDPALPGFAGGAVGYFAYDGVRYFERVPMSKPDELGLYEAYYLVTDTLVIFDRRQGTMRVVANVHVPDGADLEAAYAEGVRKIDALAARLGAPARLAAAPVAKAGELQPNMSQDEFVAMVERCKEYIRAGDVFQVVVSQRFSIRSHVDHLALYQALREINPSPYMYFLRLGGLDVVGSSPELLVRLDGERIDARPIAGTSRRGADAAEDRRIAERLIGDPKELAEHIMLVDLARNDVGRVAAAGSVHVNELQVVERYSHVMHIVSNVRGRLAAGRDAFDVLTAAFPVGTMSGAPKIRAMEIVDELEPSRRALYAGCVGYFGYDGNMDQGVVIRTFVAKGDMLYVQAGAGIVYDSVPEREYQESWNKARALLRAIERAEAGLAGVTA